MQMKPLLCTALLATCAFAEAIKYTYDDAGRLVAAIYGNRGTVTYSYDKAGNLLRRTTIGGPAVSVVGTQPASGNIGAQSFTFQFSDSAGYQTLSVVNVLINNVLDGRH